MNPPKPGDSGVIVVKGDINKAISSAPKNAVVYVPKGIYKQQVNLNKSDITLYLAPGANIVNNFGDQKVKTVTYDPKQRVIVSSNQNNVTIKGRGFIQGIGYLLRPAKIKGLTIEDVIILNNAETRMGITFWGEDLDNLIMRNTKILTEAADGIDPVSCRNCLIEKNTVYSSDDAIVIKERNRTTYNVMVRDNISWSNGGKRF